MTEERQTSRRLRVPDLLVEQLLLGELPPERALRVRNELEAQPDGLERLNDLRRSNDELLLRFPPRSVVPFIEKRAGVKQRRNPFILLLPVLVTGAAALFIGIRGPHQSTLQPAGYDDETRSKGPALLDIYDEHDAVKGHPLRSDAVVHNHNRFMIEYEPGEQKFGTVFSIDGAGQVNLMYPEQPTASQALNPKQTSVKEHSYELDEAPKFERFFIVSSKQPIDIERVLREAHSLAARGDEAASGKLALPSGLEQKSILLRKGNK